jgi:putative oxidoreductase
LTEGYGGQTPAGRGITNDQESLMRTTYTLDPRTVGLGLLVGRVVFGALFAAHGSQKLFGWFRGPGLRGTGEFFEALGFRPGRAFAAAAGLTELTSGLLILLGFLGPVGPALLLSVMTVAVITVHWGNGLLATSNGSELPLLYATVAIGLALAGPGPFSLDRLLGIPTLWPWNVTLAVLAAGVIGGLANVAARRPAAPRRA